MPARLLPLLLALLFGSGPAHADWHSLDEHSFSLGPPPTPGTSEDQEDLEGVLRAREERGLEDCSFADRHPKNTFASLYSGGPLSGEEMERATPVLEEVIHVAGRVAQGFKVRYGRPRPFVRDARVNPCIPPPRDGTSYPSGHAAAGALSACVLQKMFPAKADALARYGDKIGDYRVGVGVHYPADVAAGKRLGRDICEMLLNDGQFRIEMSQAR